MVENGRTGWYFRVLTPGTAPTSGPIEFESRHPAGVTVTMAHTARLPGAPRTLIDKVASVDALASRLKHAFDDVLIG
jgi:MOSC domain-containing protein YiiM